MLTDLQAYHKPKVKYHKHIKQYSRKDKMVGATLHMATDKLGENTQKIQYLRARVDNY